MNKFVEANKQIEKTVVTGYKKIEDTVVSGYKKIEDAFVKSFLTPDESPSQESQSDNTQSSEDKGD